MRIDLTCPVELWHFRMPTAESPFCTVQLYNLSEKTVVSIQACYLCYDESGEQTARHVERVQGLEAPTRCAFEMSVRVEEGINASGMELVIEKVWFDDGQVRLIDLQRFLETTPVLLAKPFLDLERFKEVRVEDGTVTDITFQHMRLESWLFSDVWWGKAEPIYVTSYPRAVGNHKDAGWRFPKGATEGRSGEVSHITFRHIEGVSENGCFVGGDVPGKVHDIHFEDVTLTLRRHTRYPLGVHDRRPCLGEGFITGRTYGLVTENAKVDTLRFSVILDKNFPPEQYHQLIRP